MFGVEVRVVHDEIDEWIFLISYRCIWAKGTSITSKGNRKGMRVLLGVLGEGFEECIV